MIRIKKTSSKKISKFLGQTGFLLEMEANKILVSQDWEASPEFFIDLEENKRREIDIIAFKKINNINVYLVIECKQSLIHDWIFLRTGGKPKRYYSFVKHLPRVDDSLSTLGHNNLFDHLHTMNFKYPLAQNYSTYFKTKNKAGENLQIEKCIYKLPKALIHKSSSSISKERYLFFLVALFSGQIFFVHYRRKLSVGEPFMVQFPVELDSKAYQQNLPDANPRLIFSPRFIIDFLTLINFERYLVLIDKEVKKIPVENWTVPEDRAPSLPTV